MRCPICNKDDYLRCQCSCYDFILLSLEQQEKLNCLERETAIMLKEQQDIIKYLKKRVVNLEKDCDRLMNQNGYS